MPVTLLIQVEDVDSPEPPELPEVDGLDIRSGGTPSRSSTISIINGRRSESTSVTYSYSLTPRREGTFEIPSFTVKTAGGTRQTRPVRISATTSQTGDLMFAEVAGQKEKLFVGQPIDLTLRIWLKPYRDQKLGVTISASDMWRMITEQTQWGAFAETLEKLASEGNTIGGQEVLRKDKNGVQRSYYLYEVPAKFYPKHAGQIEMGDVQIVAQYPTKLGKSRDPFESFFGDSPFGRGMFDDDFFKNRGFSPFGQSLTVTAARPIVVTPEVAPIEVTPIPTMGRPADYRGAVGQYQMITQATPAKVKAGDPITLKIGIRGTGPMELVQAPPLATLPSLTSDFKVSDEPLAGIVQDDIKVFTTSIRPRREGISQVPSIPFSFFDPETEKFVTVQSEPISIEVDKAEKLALDSIVGGGSDRQSQTKVSNTANDGPAFENYATQDVLTSQQATPDPKFWLTSFLSPAALLGLVLLVRNRQQLIPKNTARVRALAQIQRATETADVSKAILEMIASKTAGQHANLTRPEAVTVVSRWVDSTTAEQLDRFLVDCEHATYMGDVAIPLAQLKQQARDLVASLARLNPAKSCSSSWKARVQRPWRAVCATALALVMIGATAFSLYNVFGISTDNQTVANASPIQSLELDNAQKAILLDEATTAYQLALETKSTDAAEAQSSFVKAAQKYQTLVDSGVQNSQLYFNLGNAYVQSDSVGRAIANYQRAAKLRPLDFKISRNLDFALSAVGKQQSADASVLSIDPSRITSWFANLPSVVWLTMLVIGWIGLSLTGMIMSWRPQLRVRFLAVPAMIMVIAASGWITYAAHVESPPPAAIAIANDIPVYEGSSEAFPQLPNVKITEGDSLQVIQRRGDWLQIRSSRGDQGWTKASLLEQV